MLNIAFVGKAIYIEDNYCLIEVANSSYEVFGFDNLEILIAIVEVFSEKAYMLEIYWVIFQAKNKCCLLEILIKIHRC